MLNARFIQCQWVSKVQNGKVQEVAIFPQTAAHF